jgi:methylmalonyl-CoA/ethylmalonyl-CoA epimerase
VNDPGNTPGNLPLRSATIGQIAVNVHDLSRAVTFYRDTLGLKFLFEVSSMAFFDLNGIRLMLGKPEKPEFDHPASIIYYKVRDLRETHKELVAKKVTFESDPHLVVRMTDHELWMAFFKDLDGNLLALMSEL